MFEKLIDENGNLDMRNVTTLIWLNRYKPNMIQVCTVHCAVVWFGATMWGWGDVAPPHYATLTLIMILFRSIYKALPCPCISSVSLS